MGVSGLTGSVLGEAGGEARTVVDVYHHNTLGSVK